MPFDVAIRRQVPAIEIPQPVLVTITRNDAVSLDDDARRQELGDAALQENDVARLHAAHNGALVVPTDERHAEPVERIGVVAPERACGDYPDGQFRSSLMWWLTCL